MMGSLEDVDGVSGQVIGQDHETADAVGESPVPRTWLRARRIVREP
jgi:hypothetical protein